MPAVHLITGDDLASIAATARQLVAELVGPDADEFSRELFRESETQAPDAVLRELLNALRTPPFLGGRKTVWLQNFSAFAEEPTKSAKDAELSPTGRRLQELAHFIERQFPADIALVLSGPGVDKRKALYRACAAAGQVSECKRPDVGNRQWRDEVVRLLQKAAAAKQLDLDRTALEYLTDVIGTDTARLGPELEKLACYAGPTPTLDQVRDICTGTREAHFFAVTEALGHRRLAPALEALAQTLHHARDEEGECIRLIRMTAKYFRKMLHAKVALAVLRASNGYDLQRRLSARGAAEAERLRGNLLFDVSDWQVRNLAEQAGHYSGDELQDALRLLGEADRRAVSTGLPRRLMLELLVAQIVAGRPPAPRHQEPARA